MDEQENKFPSIEVGTITKSVWFLVKLRSNVEVVVQDEINFRRFTESILTLQFDNIEEANEYFGVLNNEKLEFSVITDYSRV